MLLSVLAAGTKRVVINGPFGRLVDKMNTRQRNMGMTRRNLPDMQLGPTVSVESCFFFNLQSYIYNNNKMGERLSEPKVRC